MFIPYVNKGLNILSKEQYKKLVIIIFVTWSIILTFTGHAWRFGDFDTFVFMYIIDGYLGKYYVSAIEKVRKAIICLFSCIGIYIFSVVEIVFLDIKLNNNTFLS